MTASVRTLYGIEQHQHLFAAWAAGRAAGTVKGCRFKVKQGREILEACGFNADFSSPEQLPVAADFDAQHRQWRTTAISAAKDRELSFSDGMAAKLINVYLKCRFVCGGHHAHERVRDLHPPIDRTLLKALAENNVGGIGKRWIKAAWSKLTCEQYEALIASVRTCMNGEPLWKIEEYWRGNQ